MEENEQAEQKPTLSPASIETLKTQINDFKLKKSGLEAALNMYRYDEKNYLDVLALKITDAEKKIETINFNIEAVQLNIDEAENADESGAIKTRSE